MRYINLRLTYLLIYLLTYVRLMARTVRLSSVAYLSQSVTLLRPTHRVELVGNIFAPYNDSLGTWAVCFEILRKKIKGDVGDSASQMERGMKKWRFRPITRFIWKMARDTAPVNQHTERPHWKNSHAVY